MRKKYWKVHKNDIHFFIELGANSNQIKTWNLTCEAYDNYIYINESNLQNMKYSYMPYIEDSIKYYKSKDFIYMGNFNLKKNRKDKLEKLYENSL